MNKIATINVYLEDTEGTSSSRFDETTRTGKVVLKPSNLPYYGYGDKDRLADVLAHELGHIVGEILELPEQVESHSDLFLQNFAGITTPAVLRTEEKAWELAAKMRGGKLDVAMARAMLQSYKDGLPEWAR